MSQVHWFEQTAKPLDDSWLEKAEAYQLRLTKPPGALGQLENLAVKFSAFQECLKPALKKPYVAIMAGDHGVAEEGVSAFPQAVTGEMVKNFAEGGAAISVLSQYMGAKLSVYNTGTVFELPDISGVRDVRVAAGTNNFVKQAAMSDAQCLEALAIGKSAVEEALSHHADIFIGGEMGIANTSSAACLSAKLLSKRAEELTGPGTGLDKQGVQQKAKVLQQALDLHVQAQTPLEILSTFGGFEIAALVGAYIAAAQQGLPVLIDGYITSAAALVALRLNPSIQPWLLASHQSAEPAHKMILDALDLKPLVQLDMRLGEGSGAALAFSLIQQACLLQSSMATFDAAGVSEH